MYASKKIDFEEVSAFAGSFIEDLFEGCSVPKVLL